VGDLDVVFDFSSVLKWADGTDILAKKWFPLMMRGAVTEAGLFFEREAKLGAPFDTGRLRSSIGHGANGVWDTNFAGKDYWVEVGTNVEYAPYMEYGFTMKTGHVAWIKAAGGFRFVHPFTFEGLHFMQKAANKTERILPLIVQRHMDIAIKKAWG